MNKIALHKLQIAKLHVEAFLKEQAQKRGSPNHVEVRVYLWEDNPNLDVGPRVAEVSFWIASGVGGSGSSYMQAVPENAAACFYAERLILDYFLGETEEEVLDEKWRLCHSIWGEDPK